MNRRAFPAAVAALFAAARASADSRPAILGGGPVRTEPFPRWPILGPDDETSWLEVLRGKTWYRREGEQVARFEREWAETLGVPHALATNGGTTALYAALHALDVAPGDEVIVPPYTFIATVNVVLLHRAMPVFVDSDPLTHQIDATKIEAAITSRTRAILPVHIGGAAADMDRILEIARRRDLPVIEDACQAHLGEWRGRKLGTLGEMGCFSFQASKNLNCGEGGCLVTADDELIARASAFHNNGASLHGGGEASRASHGCNLRMTEFQGSVLRSQMRRLESQAKRREENAAYLDRLLAEIPGVEPAATHDGCTRNAYHLYMLRFDREAFAGMTKKRFLEAIRAEGVPLSGGYDPLNRAAFLENSWASRAFRAVYSERQIDEWRERNRTPVNDALCGRAFWFGQTTLLGSKKDMEQIAEAFRRVGKNAAEIAKHA